jgi:hypothetical protein
MYIFNESTSTTGDWYLVKIGGDFRFSMRDGDTISSGTVTIETADGAKRLFPVSTDRTFTANMEPTIVTLCEGEHVRIKSASVGTGGDINVDAQHTIEQGDAALVLAV